MSLPETLVEKMHRDYQAEADMQSARAAAEQIGDKARFDTMIQYWSDPWALVRHLIKTDRAGRNSDTE